MKTKNNFYQYRKALVFRFIDVQGFRRIQFFDDSKMAAVADVRRQAAEVSCSGSSVQVPPETVARREDSRTWDLL
jgi:hypothetical protein